MIRVATLNIWHNAGQWPDRLHAIQSWIQRLDPDLVALQEVLVGEDFDQLELLFGADYPHRAFVAAKPFTPNPAWGMGNALVSRWPLLEPSSQPLPDSGDREKRVALHACVDSPFGQFRAVSTHLHWRLDHGWVRELQVDALATQLAALDDPKHPLPPVVCADLNAEPASTEVRYLAGLHALNGKSVHFRDAWRMRHGLADGYTWSDENPHARRALEPQRRLDYIFVGPPRNGLGHVSSCMRVFDEPVDGIWPSDHFGVFAELTT